MDRGLAEEMRSRAEREKARAFASAVAFALAKADFGEAECRRYMALAFEKDDGGSYGACLDWMAAAKAVDEGAAMGLARLAYFGLRPAALAAVASRWPSVLEAGPDGFDLLRSGVQMAALKGDKGSAAALGSACMLASGGAARVAEAFEAAIEVCRQANGVDASGSKMIDDAKLAEFLARCEAGCMEALTRQAEADPRRGRAL